MLPTPGRQYFLHYHHCHSVLHVGRLYAIWRAFYYKVFEMHCKKHIYNWKNSTLKTWNNSDVRIEAVGKIVTWMQQSTLYVKFLFSKSIVLSRAMKENRREWTVLTDPAWFRYKCKLHNAVRPNYFLEKYYRRLWFNLRKQFKALLRC